MTRIVIIVEYASKGVAFAGLLLLLLFAAATLIDGLHRALLGPSISLIRDVGGLVTAVAIASCIPLSLLRHNHITIRLVETAWPRSKPIVQLVSDVLVLSIMSLVAWQFFLLAGKLEKAHEVTWILGIPVAPFWYATALVLLFSVIVQLVVVIFRVPPQRLDLHE